MTDLISLSVALTMHLGIDLNYNQVHPHVRYQSDNMVAGVYYNSVRRSSFYVGKVHQLGDGFTLETVLATGYMYPVIPTVKLSYGNFFISPMVDTVRGKVQSGVVIGTEFRF